MKPFVVKEQQFNDNGQPTSTIEVAIDPSAVKMIVPSLPRRGCCNIITNVATPGITGPSSNCIVVSRTPFRELVADWEAALRA